MALSVGIVRGIKGARQGNTGDDQGSVRELIRSLAPYARRYRWSIVWGGVCLLLSNDFQVRVPRFAGYATDKMAAGTGTPRDYIWYAAAIVGTTVLMGLFRYAMRMSIIGASRFIERDFRNDLGTQLLGLPPSFYDRNRTGDLMSRATEDVEAVRTFIGPGVLQFLNSVILIPLALMRMVLLSPWLTLMTMLPLLALPVAMYRFGRWVHDRFTLVQEGHGTLSAMVQENLSGVRVVKAFAREASEGARFAALDTAYRQRLMQLAKVQSAFGPTLRLLSALSTVVLLAVGGPMVARGEISVGVLVEFSLIQLLIYWPMMALGFTWGMLQRAAAAMLRLRSLMNEVPGEQALMVSAPSGSEPAVVGEGPVPAVEFRHVTFRYKDEAEPALVDVSFRLMPGQHLGLVGPVGGGKSTVVALMARLYPVERGRVFLNGRDVNDLSLRDVRKAIAAVFQDTFLFGDTLAGNLRFGASPDLPREKIIDAAKIADLDRDVMQFPDGYDTLLGERGINLSGGQRQRAAMARALLREPEILVLDDSLSAVDAETEQRILQNLASELAGRSAVITTHRLSAVTACAEVLVLDHGRVTERGTHRELVSQDGWYAAMWRRQQLEDEVEQTA